MTQSNSGREGFLNKGIDEIYDGKGNLCGTGKVQNPLVRGEVVEDGKSDGIYHRKEGEGIRRDRVHLGEMRESWQRNRFH